MKRSKNYFKNIFTITFICTIFSSLALNGVSVSWAADYKTERSSDSSAYVFSPGYINAAKQKTESIASQTVSKKGMFQNAIEFVTGITPSNNEDMGGKQDDVKDADVELQDKNSATNETPQTTIVASENSIENNSRENIKIGKGQSQVYEDGRLISEVFDGERYVYAGFDEVGKATIQDAISTANAGDTVIVKAGEYNTGLWDMFGKDGVNLHGGYDEKGHQDIYNTPTVINDTRLGVSGTVEISGFTFYGSNSGSAGIMIGGPSDITSNITVSNVTFVGESSLYAYGHSYQVGGANLTTSYVTSQNNNFLGSWGISSEYFSDVVSINDYFILGADMMVESYHASLTVTDTATNLNVPISNPRAPESQAITIPPWTGVNILYLTRRLEDAASPSITLTTENGVEKVNMSALSTVFKNLLKEKGALSNTEGSLQKALVERIAMDALKEYSVSTPLVDAQQNIRIPEVEAAFILANILKNPTEDQKAILDAVESLLNAMAPEGEEDSPEVKKEKNVLIQAVTTVLLAQAIPDLLKEGDMANIRNMFSQLDKVKEKFIFEYENATKPYYSQIVKDLSKNLSLLQLKGLVSGDISEEELKKMSAIEIGKLLDKLRKCENKTFEIDYILQQEIKYRQQYIDPNNKVLEDNMKAVLQDLTKKLYGAIDNSVAVRDSSERKDSR